MLLQRIHCVTLLLLFLKGIYSEICEKLVKAPNRAWCSNRLCELECFHVINECPSPFVKFYLYKGTANVEELSLHDLSKIEIDDPLKIIFHGFLGNYTSIPNNMLVLKYQKNEENTVIVVDYDQIVKRHCYPHVYNNIRVASNCTAILIKKLYKMGMDWRNVHLLGHGMGATVAAQTSAYLLPNRLLRITGLDPMDFSFTTLYRKEEYLDKDDADIVDVLHTNAGWLGQINPCGTADFYINDGYIQPGCKDEGCDHSRSLAYLAESIDTEDGFWAHLCYENRPTESLDYYIENCPLYIENISIRYYLMGEYIDNATRGIFKVGTNDKTPYALGEPENMIPITTPTTPEPVTEPENVTEPVTEPENVTEPVTGLVSKSTESAKIQTDEDDFYWNPDPQVTKDVLIFGRKNKKKLV